MPVGANAQWFAAMKQVVRTKAISVDIRVREVCAILPLVNVLLGLAAAGITETMVK